MGVVGGGGWFRGVPHTSAHACTCTHAHACACMRGKHANGCPHWGNPWEFPMMSYTCACTHACACAHGWDAPSHHCHLSTTPLPPRGGDPGIIQNSIALELIEIFQFCEDLKSMETPPPMGGCIIWWVGWWVGSGQITKNLKIVDWIKIIQFCLKIYDL